MRVAPTYYDLLEVSPHASARVIRAAYRCLAQAHHPDKNPGKIAASEHLARLNGAYQVLSDPLSRQLYDQRMGMSSAVSDRRGRPAVAAKSDSAQSGETGHPAMRPFAFRPLR
jgi:curved DNA-binding protein CbpA